MSALNESIAKRIAKLFRLLASDFDGEVLSALRRMKAQLATEGLSLNDIAIVIENANGEIEARKYSETDAAIIFERGVAKGRSEEVRKPGLASDYYDEDNEPRWHEMAIFCLERQERLRPHELQFIEDMASRSTSFGLTERQGQWLLALFIRLGGMRR